MDSSLAICNMLSFDGNISFIGTSKPLTIKYHSVRSSSKAEIDSITCVAKLATITHDYSTQSETITSKIYRNKNI